MDCCDALATCCSGCVCLGSCMTLACGCPTKVTIDENLSSLRTCPACGDVAVSSGTSQDWLQCCFLRVIPLHTERVWVCATCDWRARIKESPSTPGAAGSSGPEMQQPRPSGEMQVPLATQ